MGHIYGFKYISLAIRESWVDQKQSLYMVDVLVSTPDPNNPYFSYIYFFLTTTDESSPEFIGDFLDSLNKYREWVVQNATESGDSLEEFVSSHGRVDNVLFYQMSAVSNMFTRLGKREFTDIFFKNRNYRS